MKLPEISKYRKPLGFVKPQYRNLKKIRKTAPKIEQNGITANPYVLFIWGYFSIQSFDFDNFWIIFSAV